MDDADEPCKHLEWDSRFFGVETARVVADTLTPERAAEIDRWCAGHRIKFLYFLARPDDPETIRLAEQGGYALTDVRMTFEQPLSADAPVNRTSSVRPFEEPDLPALRRIARTSFTDGRFYSDPHVPRAKCDELYDIWITKSTGADPSGVLVARDEGRAVGFVTCDLDAATNWGSIGLLGVDESARGRGVGRALTQGALAWFALRGLPGVTVITQGRNVVAQRLYQRCGFVTRSVRLYYHKWYD
jgi:ribosomal protein S18 acetylase RimI-like enzyme